MKQQLNSSTKRNFETLSTIHTLAPKLNSNIFRAFSLVILFNLFYSVLNASVGNYYVNDNDLTGDSYTTAVGNDGNAGTTSAPFLTIQHAIDIASSGDIIWVDAGTYDIPTAIVINKQISIRGRFYGVAGTAASRGAESILSDVRAPGTNPGAFQYPQVHLLI